MIMSNRHQRRAADKLRRADVARFRCEVGGSLDTYLVPTTDVDLLAGKPLLARAGHHWASGIATKRPECIACGAEVAVDARPGAFLFATSQNAPNTVSTSAICETCWRDLSADQIEHHCARVLHKLMPEGRFVEGWP
jgi:hypothetical protein